MGAKTFYDWLPLPFSILDEDFQTSPMHNNPSVTRIPAMALPLQEGPETCSRNVSYKEMSYKLEFSMINWFEIIAVDW